MWLWPPNSAPIQSQGQLFLAALPDANRDFPGWRLYLSNKTDLVRLF